MNRKPVLSEQVLISIVVPVYNEEESLAELHQAIMAVGEANDLRIEVIFVDDGSKDSSWQKIVELSHASSSVRGYRFNRNYGKSAALQTGFNMARGEVVITMDADLQDDPTEIPELVKMIREEGYQLVSGWKRKRNDPLSKTIPSKFFNRVTRTVSGIPLHDFNCGLKAYRQDVVKNIEVYGEMHRYIPLLAKWNGFHKIGEKVVNHKERKYGVTKFGLERYVNGFLDLISVSFVTRFRKNPMHFFGTLGTLSFLFGLWVAGYIIGEKLYNIYFHQPARDVVDQPMFFLALVALVIGTQLFLAGFIAEIIILMNPRENDYLVSETVGENA